MVILFFSLYFTFKLNLCVKRMLLKRCVLRGMCPKSIKISMRVIQFPDSINDVFEGVCIINDKGKQKVTTFTSTGNTNNNYEVMITYCQNDSGREIIVKIIDGKILEAPDAYKGECEYLFDRDGDSFQIMYYINDFMYYQMFREWRDDYTIDSKYVVMLCGFLVKVCDTGYEATKFLDEHMKYYPRHAYLVNKVCMSPAGMFRFRKNVNFFKKHTDKEGLIFTKQEDIVIWNLRNWCMLNGSVSKEMYDMMDIIGKEISVFLNSKDNIFDRDLTLSDGTFFAFVCDQFFDFDDE